MRVSGRRSGWRREIGSDLIARRMVHLAAAGAALVLAIMFFMLRNQIIQGIAASARQFHAGGLIDDAQMAQMIGRGAAAGEYWSLLLGGVLLSALFAPQLIDASRSTLPARAADLARRLRARDLRLRLHAGLCGLCLCGAALFAGVRILGLHLSATLLAVPLMTTLAFASIYAGMLLATFLFPNGLFAAIVGMATVLALAIAGNAESARPAERAAARWIPLRACPSWVGPASPVDAPRRRFRRGRLPHRLDGGVQRWRCCSSSRSSRAGAKR